MNNPETKGIGVEHQFQDVLHLGSLIRSQKFNEALLFVKVEVLFCVNSFLENCNDVSYDVSGGSH
jgi:hypothetical protein